MTRVNVIKPAILHNFSGLASTESLQCFNGSGQVSMCKNVQIQIILHIDTQHSLVHAFALLIYFIEGPEEIVQMHRLILAMTVNNTVLLGMAHM